MIQSHYSLNVALAGQHYCRIHLGTDKDAAIEKTRVIKGAMILQDPAFAFDLTYVECFGYNVKF